MAKISIIKLAIEVDSIPEKVSDILSKSPYADRISSGFMGDSVEGNIEEITNYVKIALAEENGLISKDALIEEEKARKAAEQKLDESTEFYVSGSRGRTIRVLKDRCIIKTSVTAGSVLTGNITDGEKTIFYYDCIGVQLKTAGALLGYLQIETASGLMNNNSSNFFNENTFTYEDANLNKTVREMADYIISRVALYKKPIYSPADELKKYKELLEASAITQEEYDKKKEELLSI